MINDIGTAIAWGLFKVMIIPLPFYLMLYYIKTVIYARYAN
jgi:hypothetical protein